MQEWIDASPERKTQWGDLIPSMADKFSRIEDIKRNSVIYRETLVSGSAISRPPELESFRQSYHPYSGAKAYSPPQSTDSLPQKQASATSPATAGVHVSGELSPGMRVAHFKFGEGTIISVDTSQPDHRITVQFDNAGRRVLLLKFAKFEIIS